MGNSSPEYYRQYAKNNRDKMAANSKRYSDKKRAWLDGIKLEAGCMDCGYNEQAVALDFDHVRGVKEFTVSQGNRSRATVLAEIEKCDVVCANCHRIRTHERRTDAHL